MPQLDQLKWAGQSQQKMVPAAPRAPGRAKDGCSRSNGSVGSWQPALRQQSKAKACRAGANTRPEDHGQCLCNRGPRVSEQSHGARNTCTQTCGNEAPTIMDSPRTECVNTEQCLATYVERKEVEWETKWEGLLEDQSNLQVGGEGEGGGEGEMISFVYLSFLECVFGLLLLGMSQGSESVGNNGQHTMTYTSCMHI